MSISNLTKPIKTSLVAEECATQRKAPRPAETF